MSHPLLIAARVAPYRRATSTAPVAVDDTGLDLTSGFAVTFTQILNNDHNLGSEPTVTIVPETTVGPINITPPTIENDQNLRVTANSGVLADAAWSVDYQVGTQFGTSVATASGMVRAVVTTATIIGQWEFNDGVSATVGSIPGAVDRTVLFAQPTIPATGGPSNRGGVAVNGNGHLSSMTPALQGAERAPAAVVGSVDLRPDRRADHQRQHERTDRPQGPARSARRLGVRVPPEHWRHRQPAKIPTSRMTAGPLGGSARATASPIWLSNKLSW